MFNVNCKRASILLKILYVFLLTLQCQPFRERETDRERIIGNTEREIKKELKDRAKYGTPELKQSCE